MCHSLLFTLLKGQYVNSVLTCICRSRGSCPLSSVLGKCLAYSVICWALYILHSWKKKQHLNEEMSRQQFSQLSTRLMYRPVFLSVLEAPAVGPTVCPFHVSSVKANLCYNPVITLHLINHQ